MKFDADGKPYYPEDGEISTQGQVEKAFEYDGLTYIPVRPLLSEERDLIGGRSPKEIWENAIIERPKNGDNYTRGGFLEKSGADGIDLFYCIERGKFFTPVEGGIISLNENSTNVHFEKEMLDFYNSKPVQDAIRGSRPLTFEKEKDLALAGDISSVVSDGEVFTRKNESLGDVRVKLGNPNHSGISHIIRRRMDKRIRHDGMSYEEAAKETSAIIFLSIKNISEAPATKETNGRFAIYKNGIKTAIDSDRHGRFVVTGFDFDDTRQEAADSIKSVNALYGYTPEFLEIYARVGAAYASLGTNINQPSAAVNGKQELAAGTGEPRQGCGAA